MKRMEITGCVDRRALTLSVVICMGILVGGCGRSKDGRLAVTGKVTLDGQELETGDISLLPVGKGPSVAAPIVSGRFKISADKGPSPGKYRVSIESFEPSEVTTPEFDGPSMGKQILPAKYNADTELEIEVSQSGKNAFTFELKSL